MPENWPDNLVIVERKGSDTDNRLMWKVVPVNSSFWAGSPMSYKQATFDRKSSFMWLSRIALGVADIELTHHMPCFEQGRCTEGNPLLGRTRAQGYSVELGIAGADWLLTGWLRKGDRSTHLGGLKYWWTLPLIGQASSAIGIVHTLAGWRN